MVRYKIEGSFNIPLKTIPVIYLTPLTTTIINKILYEDT